MKKLFNTPPSLYIHLPWCSLKCPYCDFNSYTKSHRKITDEDYYNALKKELKLKKSFFESGIQSIYIGGGTPSLFDISLLYKLLNFLRDLIGIENFPECTIELNPESVTLDKVKTYYEMGINRISIGGQSFNSKHLKILGRVHTSDQLFKSITYVKKYFNNFNIDIMYGLPNQTLQDALLDLKTALTFDPPHISWYQLTIEPKTAFYKQKPKRLLPLDEIINQEKEGKIILMEKGMHHYEISAFSKNNYECIHNVNYWKYGNYIGVGAGAHSKTCKITPFKILRSSNLNKPEKYVEQSEFLWNEIDEKEHLFEFMLNRLRLFKPIQINLIIKILNIDDKNLLYKKISRLETLGLINIKSEEFWLTEFGKTHYNDVVSEFL